MTCTHTGTQDTCGTEHQMAENMASKIGSNPISHHLPQASPVCPDLGGSWWTLVDLWLQEMVTVAKKDKYANHLESKTTLRNVWTAKEKPQLMYQCRKKQHRRHALASFAACLPHYLLHQLYILSFTSTCVGIPLVSLLQLFKVSLRSWRWFHLEFGEVHPVHPVSSLRIPSCTLGASLLKTKPKPPWSCSARTACSIVSPLGPAQPTQFAPTAKQSDKMQDESRWIEMNEDESKWIEMNEDESTWFKMNRDESR